MNREGYKTKREGQPKRNKAQIRIKIRMAAKAPNTTPKLREIYSTRIEWATKIMTKLKE